MLCMQLHIGTRIHDYYLVAILKRHLKSLTIWFFFEDGNKISLNISNIPIHSSFELLTLIECNYIQQEQKGGCRHVGTFFLLLSHDSSQAKYQHSKTFKKKEF